MQTGNPTSFSFQPRVRGFFYVAITGNRALVNKPS